jgi:hypothetical protein
MVPVLQVLPLNHEEILVNIARPLLLACVLATSTSWAAKSEPTTNVNDNACTWFSAIDDWRRLDNRNLLVWVSRHEVYHVELTMPLFDLGTTPSIGFVDHNRDGRLCGFGMDEVVVPHSSVFGSSTIAAMTKLDDAGVDALAAKYNIKLRSSKKTDAPSEKAAGKG